MGWLLNFLTNRSRVILTKELHAYESEEKAKVKEEILNTKLKFAQELETLMLEHATKCKKYRDEIMATAEECANDKKLKEHDFHKEVEDNRATIKILNREIELLEEKHRYIKEIVDVEEKIKSSMVILLNEKDEEIKKLTNALDKLTN